ncbi:hypothetical protein [Nostoc sp. PA-18-2419]|uniref:hypothetical protein n=1 Tax=Nostoc sp. PA-18-2419 TaxID=2575443 RepID=UPI001109A36C|nr:hypothetical protein [Nostoc sp. PA-18-2419]
MSYVSLLKNIPEIISQPIGIAALASVGIHGAIAMIVPLMPIDSTKPQQTASSKTVGLLELSQADQSRLPQSTPQVGLQQLPPIAPLSPPNFTAQTVLPSLGSPPSSQLVLPPLPPSANNYRVSSMPTRQSLRTIPSYNMGFDASKFDSSKFNNSPKFSPSVPQVPQVPRLTENDRKYEALKPLPVNRLPQLQSQNIPDDILQNAQSQNLSDTAPITTAQVNPTPQITQPSDDASKVAQNPPINSIRQTPSGNILIGTRVNNPQSSDLSPKGTQQAIAQLDSYNALRKEVQQQYPNAQQKPVIRQTLATEKPNLEGAVLGMLVVDPDGKVLDIKFQDKLLSPELRTEAREYFSKQSPKGDKKISSYPFNLVFQNNTIGASQQQKPFPLLAPGVNSNQLTPLPASTSKPLSEAPIRNSQPASLPANTLKPLIVPGANRNSPTRGTAQPSSPLQIPNNQSLPTGTLKPLVVPKFNSNQPQTLPAATSKPSSEILIRNNQLAPSPAASTSEPLSLPRVNKNQPTSTLKSEQQLLQQLRQVKENRQNSNAQ